MATIPVGSLLLSNAGSPCVFTDPAGNVLTAPSNPTIASLTALCVLDDGRYCVLESSSITVYDDQLNVTATNGSIGTVRAQALMVSNLVDTFYVLRRISANHYGTCTIDPDTAVVTNRGTFTTTSDEPVIVGIAPDESLVYISNQVFSPGTAGTISTVPIDGVGSTPTVIATEPNYNGGSAFGFSLRDGTLIVQFNHEFSVDTVVAVHYAADGTTLHTYAIGSSVETIWAFPDVVDANFWSVTGHTSGDFEDVFQQIRVSDGTVLNSWQDGPSDPGFSPSVAVPVAIGAAPQPMLTFPNTPGEVGIPYSEGLVASGGTPPYGPYTITVGTLPYGLSLDADTGVISGIPTNVQTSNFTAQVTDDNSQTADCDCSIAIGANMTIKSVGLIDPVLRMGNGRVN